MKFNCGLRVWLSVVTVALIMAAMQLPHTAWADVTYGTFTKDSYGHQMDTQPAYTPFKMIGKDLAAPDPDHPGQYVASPMQKPSDVYISASDEIYVADTGNNRIVKFDKDGNFQRYYELAENPLNAPQGVFVDDKGDLLIADTGNKRVVRLSSSGELLKEYKRPESGNVPEELKFDPIKVAADKRGYIYIVTMGGYYGLVQLHPDGEFQRFYGANSAPFSFIDSLKRALYTREMYENETSKIPPAVNNLAIDEGGFIYTVTNGAAVEAEQIKKLNFQGENILAQYNKFGTAKQSFGEYNWYDIRYVGGITTPPQLVDVAVDPEGNFTVVDSYYTYLSQYDANGNLLFYFGGPSSAASSQLGLIKTPVAIDMNSKGEIYVLDSQESMLQAYRLSEFGAMVHEANRLTQEGRYLDSEEPWKEVLRLNEQYLPAILGLAQVAYKKGDYEEAARLFKAAGNDTGYSESFWQIRLQWFQARFSFFATLLVVAAVLIFLVNRLARGRTPRMIEGFSDRMDNRYVLFSQIKQAFVILRHPIDGFTALRFENKGGYVSACILLVLTGGALLLSEQMTSFAFNPVPPSSITVTSVLLPFLGLWCGWVVSNYLISSIYRGEGRFKDVFVGSAYALTPFILIGVPLAALSNVMTHAEGAIYDYLQLGMYIWLVFLFIWMVQSLHNYTVGETLLNIIMSLFALIVLAVLIFLVIGLTNELLIFIHEVYQEVLLR
ncbi:YIP1 family protein [Paenibacillus sp. PDC88]|uniref:YIP1 family protein n=1 Tax=Paenibacillus sp. PDC88 TaxID=1884375 RepID=UPI0008957728|nr:YIP1 family protein [Paenibacillus sp. PDC88]SDX04084.1 SMP-30/Gluconolaconase/LRE-like region-containing protein [Paenibacillus sp. PDC88]